MNKSTKADILIRSFLLWRKHDFTVDASIDANSSGGFVEITGENGVISGVTELENITTITLVGSVHTGIKQKYIEEGLFDPSWLVSGSDKYTILELKNILPIGECSVIQKNGALSLFFDADTQYPGNIKTKDYVIEDGDRDYCVMLHEGDNVTITISQGDSIKVYKILNELNYV